MTSMNNLVQQFYKSYHVQGFLPTLTTQRFPLCIALEFHSRCKNVQRFRSIGYSNPKAWGDIELSIEVGKKRQMLVSRFSFLFTFRPERRTSRFLLLFSFNHESYKQQRFLNHFYFVSESQNLDISSSFFVSLFHNIFEDTCQNGVSQF